jgi:hypothetical protein
VCLRYRYHQLLKLHSYFVVQLGDCLLMPCASPFHLRSVFKSSEQFLNLLRFNTYFEPRVPAGCFVNIVVDAPGFEALGIPVDVGLAMFAFAAPP